MIRVVYSAITPLLQTERDRVSRKNRAHHTENRSLGSWGVRAIFPVVPLCTAQDACGGNPCQRTAPPRQITERATGNKTACAYLPLPCQAFTRGGTHNLKSGTSILVVDDAAVECAVVAKQRQDYRLQDREHGGRDCTVVCVATACSRKICKFPWIISTFRDVDDVHPFQCVYVDDLFRPRATT